MAEYDKGRLYWIKLTDGFMGSDTVDYLMSQKNGSDYVLLYQMLCLKTVNQEGILAKKLGEVLVSYSPEKIQRDCKWFSLATIKSALKLYKQLGLIYEKDNEILAISDFGSLIGSQTYGAEKKEKARQEADKKGTKGGQKGDICPPEIDNKRIRDKDKEKEIKESVGENASTSTATAVTNAAEVVSLYNSICVSLAPVKKVTSSRVDAVNEILQKSSIEELEELFRKAEDTPLLKGENKMRWKANFDWLIVEQNAAKVLEGRYTDSDTVTVDSSGTAATYDLEEFFKAAVSSERRKEEVG